MLTEGITDTSDSPPAARVPPATEHWTGHRRLADEHAVLLHEVRLRGSAVRAMLGAGRWPDREVDKLVAYLRYEVLDQATNEEGLLFPLAEDGLANSLIHGLVDDHARVRDLADQLAAASTVGGEPREPRTLVDLLDDLEDFLDEHMHTEQAVLATATSDGVESRRHPFRCHLWFPITEGPEVNLDALPGEFAHRAALERFSRLRPGQHLFVTSRGELESLWNVLACGHPGEFGWRYLEEGPERWRVEVTRRLEN